MSLTDDGCLNYHDLGLAGYGMDTTGSITLLNQIPQGVSVNDRVGKRLCLETLQVRGSFEAGSTAIFNKVALLVVYDKRPSGTLPSITDILEAANSTALNNTQNEGRFDVLFRIDEGMVGGATLLDTTYSVADFEVDLQGRPTTYKALGTGAIADISEGALYLVTVGDNPAGTAAVTAPLQIRVRFSDF